MCYICEENHREVSKATAGACMQCNKNGCKMNFHVTWYVTSRSDISRSLVVRKPVFGVSDQVPHKPGCTVTEDV